MIRAACASAALLALAPTVALADVSGLQVRMTDSAAEIVVISADDLGQPRVRTERGEVEVWFPTVHDNNRIAASGDGVAIYRARLRPGMGASAVLDIDVGGRRKVELSDVTVERQEGATLVRINRSALLGTSTATQPAPVVSAVVATPIVARATSQPVASVATEIVGAPLAAPTTSTGLGTKPAKPGTGIKPKKEPATLASGGESKLPTLIALTLVLGAILGAIKLWQRKGHALLREPDIEVVAHKRLAPGLQLFIVRAFGQEHLLSVNGKSTERIATNESFDDVLTKASETQRPGFKLPNEPGVELIPSRSVLAPITAPKRSLRAEPSIDMPMPMPRVPMTTSQSIAGLIRLREEADRAN